jgi:hypothetical protein
LARGLALDLQCSFCFVFLVVAFGSWFIIPLTEYANLASIEAKLSIF